MNETQPAGPVTYDDVMALAQRAKDSNQGALAYVLCITAGAWEFSGVAGFNAELMLVRQLASVEEVIELMSKTCKLEVAVAQYAKNDPERN